MDSRAALVPNSRPVRQTKIDAKRASQLGQLRHPATVHIEAGAAEQSGRTAILDLCRRTCPSLG